MIIIKKILCLILFFTLLISACNYSPGVSIEQTFDLPDKVQNVMNPDDQLQLIKRGMNAYIIFQSTETLTLTEIEVIDEILHISLNSEDQENTELKQYLFKMNPGNVKVEVLINGIATSFDNTIDL